jgi:hypothetical protein
MAAIENGSNLLVEESSVLNSGHDHAEGKEALPGNEAESNLSQVAHVNRYDSLVSRDGSTMVNAAFNNRTMVLNIASQATTVVHRGVDDSK